MVNVKENGNLVVINEKIYVPGKGLGPFRKPFEASAYQIRLYNKLGIHVHVFRDEKEVESYLADLEDGKTESKKESQSKVEDVKEETKEDKVEDVKEETKEDKAEEVEESKEEEDEEAEEMTVSELKKALDEAGVEYDKKALKKDLVELYNSL